MNTGERIKLARIKVGLTQKELAEKLECTQAMISAYEKGLRNPKVETLEKIAKALNTTGYDLLDYTFKEYQLYKAHEDCEPDEANNALVINGILISEKNLIRQFNALNNSGKYEAIRRVSELKHIPDYTCKEETPFD